MYKKLLFATFGLALMGFTPPAYAVVIDQGDWTWDQDTNLDWLDLTQTTNMSYYDVVAAISGGGLSHSGYDLSEWRFATMNEVQTLFDNITGVTVGGSYYRNLGTDNNNGVADEWVQILGDTFNNFILEDRGVSADEFDGCGYEGCYVHYSWGITSTAYPGDAITVAFLKDEREDCIDCVDHTSNSALLKNDRAHFFGSWLVRAHVEIPEPATFALFGIGLAGIGFTARRRRKAA